MDSLHVEEDDDPWYFSPTLNMNDMGVEDPRSKVRIDETYYLTYTAYDGVNALGHWLSQPIWSILKRLGS